VPATDEIGDVEDSAAKLPQPDVQKIADVAVVDHAVDHVSQAAARDQ
jgi:hypothetical protein